MLPRGVQHDYRTSPLGTLAKSPRAGQPGAARMYETVPTLFFLCSKVCGLPASSRNIVARDLLLVLHGYATCDCGKCKVYMLPAANVCCILTPNLLLD